MEGGPVRTAPEVQRGAGSLPCRLEALQRSVHLPEQVVCLCAGAACARGHLAAPPHVQAVPALPKQPHPVPTPMSPCPQPEACRTLAPERDKPAKHCSIQLPDGTACMVLVRAGLSIKDVLAGLCERHGINGAAVDLFLAGGDKVRL